jgi:two-component system CAI-1 autoinducer sensor kinase/phosphatase CqsS
MLSSKIPFQGGLLGVSIDITHRKQKEEAEKREAQIRAQYEADLRQALVIIVSSVVHDLRTPILTLSLVGQGINQSTPTVLSGYHWALDQGWGQTPISQGRERQLAEAGDTIARQTEEMSEYINSSLKTLQKAMSGDLTSEDLTPCSMAKLVHQTVEKYPYQAGEEANVDVSGVNDFTFQGNAVLMLRVLNNLLGNALEQRRQQGQGVITFSSGEDDQAYYLYVQDTAGGATPEQVAQLFDTYYTTKAHGTGVGLPFCRQVKRDLGGDITAQSQPGQWMLFTLQFPKIA